MESKKNKIALQNAKIFPSITNINNNKEEIGANFKKIRNFNENSIQNKENSCKFTTDNTYSKKYQKKLEHLEKTKKNSFIPSTRILENGSFIILINKKFS